MAKTRAEAIRLCAPSLGLEIEPPDEAEQILAIHRRLSVNHLVMSTEWAGMPQSLAIETIDMIAGVLFPRVTQGL